MIALPIKYNIANVFVGWRSTLSTIIGIGMVVAVTILVQSLAVGLKKAGADTGEPENLLVMRKGSTAESSSQVTLAQVRTIQYLEGVARDANDKPLISPDVLVLINLPRRVGGEANILLRGVGPLGKELRPNVDLVEGRWFVPGRREVLVSKKLSERFANTYVGDKFKLGQSEMTVVGLFDAHDTAFDSEFWMDADETRSMFTRENYSSLLVKTTSPEAMTNLMTRIEKDKTLSLKVVKEAEFYKTQTMTGVAIQFIGTVLAIAMSIGAVLAAMNTMYASVGARTREVGTLRVLGYRRRTILISFLVEGALLALLGGILGCFLAWPLNGMATGTMSFNTFSEVVFKFSITPVLVAEALVFSIALGVFGSLLPAIRAARLPVISALKSV
jgi:putative ABC transport system permease protein